MNASLEKPVDAAFLKAAVKRDILGEVDCVTISHDGWVVYLHNPDDVPACNLRTWAGLAVRYAVFPRIARAPSNAIRMQPRSSGTRPAA